MSIFTNKPQLLSGNDTKNAKKKSRPACCQKYVNINPVKIFENNVF